MPALKKMLLSYDLDLINRISRFWGVDQMNSDFSTAVNNLFNAMNDPVLVVEILDSLTQPAKEAWAFLGENNQKVTWTNFSRKFGGIREYGPAKREREAPENHPVSAAETLWYRGLIGRAFLNIPPEPREFVYIPDELLTLIWQSRQSNSLIPVRPVGKSELKKELIADTRILDYMTDWLSARRMNRTLPSETYQHWGIPESFIKAIANQTGLIDKTGVPETESLKRFFLTDRAEVMHDWFTKWKNSATINDLRFLPGLVFEGAWQNDPVTARTVVLENLQNLDPTSWYCLASFINLIKEKNPDFQRPAGDYDSWFIRRTGTECYLRGFENWDEVDGALITSFITGPLYWLGMVNLAFGMENSEVVAFKLSSRFFTKALEPAVVNISIKEPIIRISTDLLFTVPVFSSLSLRYQIGRFCDLISSSAGETLYQVTPTSLMLAQKQGLKPGQLVQYLEKIIKTPLPKTLALMANRWEKHGLESTIEKKVLLRAAHPEVMLSLQQNARISKFILEVLTPTTVIIDKSGVDLIKKTLIELGILTLVELDV